MTQLTQEQRDAVQAAGWTEEEVTAFAQAVVSFRDGLPPRQRDAFTAILATAAEAASEDDVQGHNPLLLGIFIGAAAAIAGAATAVELNKQHPLAPAIKRGIKGAGVPLPQ